MSLLLEIFKPYLTFISFFITISFNLWLIVKVGNWYIIIFANVVLSLLMNFLGLGSYDVLTQAIKSIADMIKDLFSGLLGSLKIKLW